jgi:hypothetical protein
MSQILPTYKRLLFKGLLNRMLYSKMQILFKKLIELTIFEYKIYNITSI